MEREPGPSALARLVGDVDDFAATRWGRAPLHRATDDRLDDVLTVDAFARWLASCPRRPTVRLVGNGANVPENRYCRATRLGSQTLADVVDHDAVLAEFGQGATIVGQSLHRVLPRVADFAADLEHELTHRVQVNAYLSPRGASGLTPHRDGHDVMAVQLAGSKQWEVEGLGTLSMSPGDLLYLPSGTRHCATTNARPSLHLTIGIHPVTRRALIAELLRSAEALDSPLPVGFARRCDEERVALAVDCLEGARAALAATSPEPSLVSQLAPRSRRHRSGGFASAFRAAEVDATQLVQIRPELDCRLRVDDDHVAVTFRGWSVTLPIAARPAIEQLLGGCPVEVGRLADLDRASQVVVARRLVEEGVLEIVDGAETEAATEVAASAT